MLCLFLTFVFPLHIFSPGKKSGVKPSFLPIFSWHSVQACAFVGFYRGTPPPIRDPPMFPSELTFHLFPVCTAGDGMRGLAEVEQGGPQGESEIRIQG